MKLAVSIAALLTLGGCSSFKLGAMHYCPADSECTTSARPFRGDGGGKVPPGPAVEASGVAVPVVK